MDTDEPRPPFCAGGCGEMITREGASCYTCCQRLGTVQDECTCYSGGPGDCDSKLSHDCCCDNAFGGAYACRAEDGTHCCTCLLDPACCQGDVHSPI